MPLSPGQFLQNNRYQIIRPLGQGGMAAVYQAADRNLNIPVAIKENLDPTPEAAQLFIQEAQMLSRLSHPSLPRVSDYFIIPGQGQYLVMDYVEGQNLLEMLEQAGGPLPEAQIVAWIVQVCDAVAHLHALVPPIIHRDIKPDNIKIRPDGRAILVDFGIAKFYDATRATLLAHGRGTPGYCPPEQYGRGRTDARTDIYALGATLYAMLTGVEPPESVELVAGSEHLIPPRQLNPQISAQVETAILKCMALDSRYRFQSMDDLSDALLGRTPLPSQGALVSSSAPTKPGIYSQPTIIYSPPRHRRLRGCLGGIALLLLSIFCVLLLTVSMTDGTPVWIIPSPLATFFRDPTHLPVIGPFVRLSTPVQPGPGSTLPPLPGEHTRESQLVDTPPAATPRSGLIAITFINQGRDAVRGLLYQVIDGQEVFLTNFEIGINAQDTVQGYYGPGTYKIQVRCGEKVSSNRFYIESALTLTIDTKCKLVR